MTVNQPNRFENATLQFYTNHGKVEDQDLNNLYLSALQTHTENDQIGELAQRNDIKKISLSDYSITLPEGTSKIGAFLYAQKDTINEIVHNCLQNSNFQDDAEKTHLTASFIQLFTQDVLNIYAYNKEDREMYIDSCIDDLKERYLQIEQYMKDHAVISEESQNEDFINYSEFQKYKDYFNPKEWVHLFEDSQGVDNLCSFLDKLSHKIFDSEEFAKKSQESDRKFLEKHYSNLKNISNEQVKALYLETLPHGHLEWLDRLNTGTDKTSVYIKNKVSEIKESREFVENVTATALGVVFFGAMLSMRTLLKGY